MSSMVSNKQIGSMSSVNEKQLVPIKKRKRETTEEIDNLQTNLFKNVEGSSEKRRKIEQKVVEQPTNRPYSAAPRLPFDGSITRFSLTNGFVSGITITELRNGDKVYNVYIRNKFVQYMGREAANGRIYGEALKRYLLAQQHR